MVTLTHLLTHLLVLHWDTLLNAKSGTRESRANTHVRPTPVIANHLRKE